MRIRLITKLFIATIILCLFFLTIYSYTVSIDHKQSFSDDDIVLINKSTLNIIVILSSIFFFILLVTWRFDIKQMNDSAKKSYDLLQQENTKLSLIVKSRADELQQSKAELDSFCYSVSHDLQGPVARLDGFIQLLQSGCESIKDEETLENLSSVRKNIDNLSRLINSLLAYSRAGRMAPTLEPVNLSQIVSARVDYLLLTNPTIQVDWKISKDIIVDADFKMMVIVIEKLLNNAVKYSSTIDNACIEFSSTSIDEQLVYFIRDNGVGFNMKYADKLFGVFQRMHSDTHFDGVGIDLAIVKRLIQRHHGTIWAEAEADKGATFYFRLG